MRKLLTTQIGFTFQVVSDVHLETMRLPYPKIVEPKSDVLFLAGDIGKPFVHNNGLKTWLSEISKQFKVLVYVPGNHEYYSDNIDMLDMADIDNELKSYEESIDNLCFLNPGVVEIGGVRVVGGALWSHVPKHACPYVKGRLNDYRRIYLDGKTIDVSDTVNIHETQLEFITYEITKAAQLNKPSILCTHHSPMLLHTSPDRYMGAIHNPSLHGFGTDLMYLFRNHGTIGNSSLAWAIHGHTHHNQMSEHYGTTVYSNQRGYHEHHTGNKYNMDEVHNI